MKSRDFAYWLQGSFEIGELEALNERQFQIVEAHLKMVFAHEKNPEFPFVHWLKGFLSGKTSLDVEGVKILRAEINSVFEHVIDPSFKDKELLEKLHVAGRKGRVDRPFDPHTTKIMC